MSQARTTSLGEAIEAFQRGTPVLVHDAADREGETDLMLPAVDVTFDDVIRFRQDAGGLICVAVADPVARAFELPFLEDLLEHPTASQVELAYDDRSAFSLPVNHRDTVTGITDQDRALTIAELGRAAATPEEYPFAQTFRAPGHVHLLRGAPNLLADREGHTELGLVLAEAADRSPAVTLCEMLDSETGQALMPGAAKRYARRHDLPYVEGSTIRNELW